MAKFYKGMKRPEGAGRKKGSGFADISAIRSALGQILAKELEPENLESLMEALEPRERLDALCKLLPYVVPKLQQQSAPLEQDPQPQIVLNVLPLTHDHLGNPLTDSTQAISA